MNEFGQVSIDTSLVKNQETSLVELTNGSIFCSCLKTDFINGLIDLVDRDLDEIYVESSGLADPSNFVDILELVDSKSQGETEYCGSICLVDGLYFFQELEKLVAVEQQIKHSHVVLINKCDLIEPHEIEKIRSKICEINDRVIIYETVKGWTDNLTTINDTNIAFLIEGEETSNTESNKPKTYSLEFAESVDMDLLSDFMKRICDGFYRIKGLLMVEETLYKVDSVGKQIDIRKANESEEEQFAKNLDKPVLVFLASQGMKSFQMLMALSVEVFGDKVQLHV